MKRGCGGGGGGGERQHLSTFTRYISMHKPPHGALANSLAVIDQRAGRLPEARANNCFVDCEDFCAWGSQPAAEREGGRWGEKVCVCACVHTDP